MIYGIKINKFRAFKDVEFRLGKYITVIAGQNATGKSTLLGMLGHSCELKKKEGVPIFSEQFRTEFSEIFKASKKYDCSGSNLYEIYFTSGENEDNIEYSDIYRATWQEGGERYRLIGKRPGATKKGYTEAKVKMPSMYLGLSRLYPIGEVQQNISLKRPPFTEDEEKWLIEQYNNILALNDPVNDLMNINTSIKKGIGISTSTYDYLVNSSGEDNLGQILSALLSFKRLKYSPIIPYEGGLLLIDEVDATFHPSVQLKLYQLLIDCAKRFNLQIVFTTHSMTLLERACVQCEHNLPGKTNNIELVYLTNANIKLEIISNPSFQQIKYDLLNSSSTTITIRKIIVYTEDEEARWFLRKLIPDCIEKLLVLDIKMGHDNLLTLRRQDPNYFSTVLFVLDGDVEQEKTDGFDNVLLLPGNSSPEEMFYNFLESISNNPEHELWNSDSARKNGFTIRAFKANGPDKIISSECKRVQLKKWFNRELPLFEQMYLFEYWKKITRKLYMTFVLDL